MPTWTATGTANANIAFIKYWGNVDETLRLPANGSISMNLGGLFTRTTVSFRSDLDADRATIGDQPAAGAALARISGHLEHMRRLAGVVHYAEVVSSNNFPAGAGIASSASAFAALTVAAAAALGLELSERALSSLARLGSGSACRSVPAGFVEWYAAATHEASYAETIAPADHWPLIDLIAVVSRAHKQTGSTQGHAIAATSPLQTARINSAPARLAQCRQAILARDFDALAAVAELDSNAMHAVMMTGSPPLFYWQPETMAIMQLVRAMRAQGTAVFYTVDAGPNVHCLCAPEAVPSVRARLAELPGVLDVLEAPPGGAARVESVEEGATPGG